MIFRTASDDRNAYTSSKSAHLDPLFFGCYCWFSSLLTTDCGKSSAASMATKRMKLELIRMLFFVISLATVSLLYAIYRAAPCTYLSGCPDDFIIDFARPRGPLFLPISLLSERDQTEPDIYEPKVSSYGGPGIESHPQISIWASKTRREKVEFYSAIFRDLAGQGLLRSGFKALCVGASSSISVVALRENGLLEATAVDDRRSLAAMKADNRRLPFADNSFDFVFSGSFDRATVPAFLASDIERTLKANGVAVMLLSPRRPNMGKHSLRSVVALFKSSDVVHVNTSGSPNSLETTVIALRKRASGGSKPLRLIKEYRRSKQNRSLVKVAEPLTKNHSNAIYLPTVKDISGRKRYIYVEIGGNSNSSNNNTVNADAGWFLASYPKQNQTFDMYSLNNHANLSGLNYHAKNLSGPKSVSRRSLKSIKQVVGNHGSTRSRERFDIAGWLSEMSVSDEDFVVVRMGFEHVTREMINKRGTGIMRLIDELFVQCSPELSEKVNVECLHFLQTLRDNGVFIHRW